MVRILEWIAIPTFNGSLPDIAGTNINNLRCADDTTLMAESEEELKSLFIESERGE